MNRPVGGGGGGGQQTPAKKGLVRHWGCAIAPRVVRSARRLPLPLLLLALSTVFLFGNDRGHFYRPGHHSGVSANHLTVAENLSPKHNFLLFFSQTLDEGGALSYHPYSRFPLGGYALIKLAMLPFIVLGLLRGLKRARRPSVPFGLAVKSWVSATPFRRCLTLGAVTLLFGIAVLSFNLGNEHRALGGEVPLTELPTVQSMVKRFGGDGEYNALHAERLAWGNFLATQLYRIARATLPFYISPFHSHFVNEGDRRDYLGVIVGAAALAGAVVGLLAARHKMLLATLLCAGFCWALPMRHVTAMHEFEAVFFVGVPLVLFSAGLLRLRALFGGRLVVGLAAASLLVFVLSSFQMGRVGDDRQVREVRAAVTADFGRIRAMAEPGQSVFLPASKHELGSTTRYYLAGRVIGRPWLGSPDSFAYDYLVSQGRVDVPALLTPRNRRFFLYRQSGLPAQMDDVFGQSELLLRRDGCCDVRRSGNTLFYSGRQARRGMGLFLHLHPVDAGDLPDHRRRHGFDNLDFHFGDHALPLTDRSVAVRQLPDYPIAHIRTGQFAVNGDGTLTELWEGEVRFNE